MRILFANFVTLTICFASVVYANPTIERKLNALKLINDNYYSTITTNEGPLKNITLACKKQDVTVSGTDPLDASMREVKISIYIPRKRNIVPSQLKTILLMPPTGGENALDRGYANRFCDYGFRVALVKSWAGDTKVDLDPIMHDHGAIRMMAAIRHVIEFLKPERSNQIGILGTSVGGISASLVLALEPRISAGALIAAGAGMSHIIGTSTQSTLKSLREARMKALNMNTVNEYEAKIKDTLMVEPLDFLDGKVNKPILMVIADQDLTVPTSDQNALFKGFGSQQSIHVDSDHIGAILKTYLFHRHEIVNFFTQTLK